MEMKMRRGYMIFILFLLSAFFGISQSTKVFADSILRVHHIPELAYAVVSGDKILEMEVLGLKKINSARVAQIDDKFRIGSNTKAITGFIAALMVKQHKIKWNTPFFELFPELKETSNSAYHQLTLLQLLSFRTKLFPYTYTYEKPRQDQFSGDEEQQRYQFTKWFFEQKPISKKDSINFSNLGYTAAGMMLEKASGKTYKQLVTELGTQLDIEFAFGAPNSIDTLQPWGHDENLVPEMPGDNYKLNWLLPAGNINVSLPDYVKFIQLQLQGLQGKSVLLSKEEFNFLHNGLFKFSVGWFWTKYENGHILSYNFGNPGTFLTRVYIYHQQNKAIILFSNVQSDLADSGLEKLEAELNRKYIK